MNASLSNRGDDTSAQAEPRVEFGQAGPVARRSTRQSLNPVLPAKITRLHGRLAPAEIVLLNADGVIVAANQAWRSAMKAYGVPVPRAGVGCSYGQVAGHFVSGPDIDNFMRSLRRLTSKEVQQIRHKYAIVTSAGRRWRQVEVSPMRYGARVLYIAMHEDLTAQLQTEEALQRASEELLSAKEDERARIGMELHDSTSQHLAVLAIGLARLRKSRIDDTALKILDEMNRSLQETIKETRVLSYLGKPSALAQDGLEEATRAFVLGFMARTGLEGRFMVRGDVGRAPADVQHGMFRVIQEAMSNAYRHSGARRVDVELYEVRGQVVASVTDDGRGFQEARPGGREGAILGVGIPGMRTRMEQLSGRLAIVSSGSGTQVVATVPLKRRRSRAA